MMINWLNENINLDDVKKEILDDYYEDRCQIIMSNQILVRDDMNYVFIKSSAITLKMYIMQLITDNYEL